LPLELKDDQDIYVTKGMIRADFEFWVGTFMDKFYDGLQEKKFIGTKCSKCGKVFLPPRNVCGDCFAKAEAFVDLPETGVLKEFTVTDQKVTERTTKKGNKETIVGLVQIDGANTAMLVSIVNATPDQVKEGMKVKVVWAAKIKGQPGDITGFEPVKGA
jgi:uncharacterized OB-fold protein